MDTFCTDSHQKMISSPHTPQVNLAGTDSDDALKVDSKHTGNGTQETQRRVELNSILDVPRDPSSNVTSNVLQGGLSKVSQAMLPNVTPNVPQAVLSNVISNVPQATPSNVTSNVLPETLLNNAWEVQRETIHGMQDISSKNSLSASVNQISSYDIRGKRGPSKHQIQGV